MRLSGKRSALSSGNMGVACARSVDSAVFVVCGVLVVCAAASATVCTAVALRAATLRASTIRARVYVS